MYCLYNSRNKRQLAIYIGVKREKRKRKKKILSPLLSKRDGPKLDLCIQTTPLAIPRLFYKCRLRGFFHPSLKLARRVGHRTTVQCHTAIISFPYGHNRPTKPSIGHKAHQRDCFVHVASRHNSGFRPASLFSIKHRHMRHKNFPFCFSKKKKAFCIFSPIFKCTFPIWLVPGNFAPLLIAVILVFNIRECVQL